MKSAIILLSGGLDSLVSLSMAMDQCMPKIAITFDYNQRAAIREKMASAAVCSRYDVEHHIISLPWLSSITQTALVDRTKSVPTPTSADLNDSHASAQSAAAVWVPNRNGLFLNIAGAYADAHAIDWIITGFNKEEAATFPDNSIEFMNRTSNALALSTRNHPVVMSFVGEMTKTEMIAYAIESDLPIEMAWPCYFSEEKWCGHCESCQRFKRALFENGILEKYLPYFMLEGTSL